MAASVVFSCIYGLTQYLVLHNRFCMYHWPQGNLLEFSGFINARLNFIGLHLLTTPSGHEKDSILYWWSESISPTRWPFGGQGGCTQVPPEHTRAFPLTCMKNVCKTMALLMSIEMNEEDGTERRSICALLRFSIRAFLLNVKKIYTVLLLWSIAMTYWTELGKVSCFVWEQASIMFSTDTKTFRVVKRLAFHPRILTHSHFSHT